MPVFCRQQPLGDVTGISLVELVFSQNNFRNLISHKLQFSQQNLSFFLASVHVHKSTDRERCMFYTVASVFVFQEELQLKKQR